MSGIAFESVDGFPPDLHRYMIKTRLRADYILVTLTLFSRSWSFKWNMF